MKSVVYYPYFEVQDTDWLKFASLYVGELTTMIPENGLEKISDETRNLIEEKNFIKNYNSFKEFSIHEPYFGIDKVDEFLKSASLKYSGITEEQLRAKEYQTYEIFNEKFSYAWRQYCLENKLGHRSSNGIKVSNEVALIYMYTLAKEIAESQNASPITDRKYGQEFLSIMSSYSIGKEVERASHEDFAKHIINFKLPAAISDIEVKEFMDLRKDKRFIENQIAFHSSLDHFLESNNSDYLSAYLDSLQEMERDIKRWMPATFSLVVAASEVFIEPQNPFAMYGLGESMYGLGAIAMTLNKENAIKRNSNKFLTDISNLKTSD